MGLIIFPIHFCLQVLNLAFWATLAVTFGLLKFMIRNQGLRVPIDAVLKVIIAQFGVMSVAMIKFFNRIDIDYKVNGELNPEGWYLVVANHLSYLDIILLIAFTHERIPTPKFFLKQELIWLPFVGVAAWALEMPFMKRYSQDFIKKNPHLKGKDIETTRKHCEKYRDAPTTIINFVEGTRFTPAKQAAKGNKFKHLLPPKAGGIAFTFAAMGELFTNILDVTLIYPGSKGVIMMDMLSGNLKQVIFDVDILPVKPELIGDYFNDAEFRDGFQQNLNQHWQNKDAKITALLEELKA
ncbi:acyltransferase [Planctobacterium marinum]|uniref:Acyltransferase n=1 Tax=Planctobacterium marinum TaxID=1631968 RepID=A0AA48I8M2_9ALTE|nr:acyltransferase [Planctobacterium marinum]